ncbi:MAG: WYL domain-containing protein [Mycobacteriales bacterium]
MSAKKTERLLNLVICLLHTRRYLTVADIRTAVPGYQDGSDDAFRRMFERDKEELRDLGIPLETGSGASGHNDEMGYRIARGDYELPPVALEPDEAAALGLAARLWQAAPLAGAVGTALLKLRAAGVEAADAMGALEPRVASAEPAFDACLAAVTHGRRLSFSYRASGRPHPEQRTVDGWGVVWWHGRWYLVGHDVARAAIRVFRLSRMVGEVTAVGPVQVPAPEDTDLRQLVARMARDEPRQVATVLIRSGAGWALRREATSLTAHDDDWDVADVGFSDADRFADRVCGFGADVVVLAPAEARRAVIERLTALAS